jgi:hypothetical protein
VSPQCPLIGTKRSGCWFAPDSPLEGEGFEPRSSVETAFSRPPRKPATTSRPGRPNRILTIDKGVAGEESGRRSVPVTTISTLPAPANGSRPAARAIREQGFRRRTEPRRKAARRRHRRGRALITTSVERCPLRSGESPVRSCSKAKIERLNSEPGRVVS